MQLARGARVAVIGAGPGGLVAAKHALDAGFDVSVFEAADALGGQWNQTAAHSGIWPGMHTNTSRAMTAFSDLPAPAEHPLHPAATQVLAYLRVYAERFAVTPRIRSGTPVTLLRRAGSGWAVDGEPFAGVVLASGRFRRPRVAPGLGPFAGELLHAFDYPGAAALAGRRVLVYGNGVSGLEIAGDLAGAATVTSAFRKPRYVLEKVTDGGISSDWRWYTYFGALQRRGMTPEAFATRLRDQIVSRAGHPADFGAPAPDPDLRVAGTSLSQGYLGAVAAGDITCRPQITDVHGGRVTFADGATERFDTVIAATGYDLDLPYLDDELRQVLVPRDLTLHHHTVHPDLPGLGVIGQFLLQGPYFPILELQARWIVALFAGQVQPPDVATMRRAMATPGPPIEAHNALAATLGEQAGVAPDLLARPELTEGLLFGPMLPLRYRLDGPGALPGAAAAFLAQLAASPRDPVAADDLQLLRELGLAAEADVVARALDAGPR
jgi:hypothetical protein